MQGLLVPSAGRNLSKYLDVAVERQNIKFFHVHSEGMGPELRCAGSRERRETLLCINTMGRSPAQPTQGLRRVLCTHDPLYLNAYISAHASCSVCATGMDACSLNDSSSGKPQVTTLGTAGTYLQRRGHHGGRNGCQPALQPLQCKEPCII